MFSKPCYRNTDFEKHYLNFNFKICFKSYPTERLAESILVSYLIDNTILTFYVTYQNRGVGEFVVYTLIPMFQKNILMIDP